MLKSIANIMANLYSCTLSKLAIGIWLENFTEMKIINKNDKFKRYIFHGTTADIKNVTAVKRTLIQLV